MLEFVDNYMNFQWLKFRAIATMILFLFSTSIPEVQWAIYLTFNAVYVGIIYMFTPTDY